MDERRYFGLDALRASMMFLGIVLHGATFYLSAPPPTMPFPLDPRASYVFDVIFHFIHSFRMPVFFLLAGFFAALLMERRGLLGTWQNRGARVLGPLLAGMLTVVPLAALFGIDLMLSRRFGIQTLIPPRAAFDALINELQERGFPALEPSPGHLWFLYYLLYFYLLLPICHRLARGLQPQQPALQRRLQSPWLVLLLGSYTAATLWPFHGGQLHEGFIFFKPHLPSMLYYGSFFVLGYLLHTCRSMLDVFKLHMPWCTALACVLFPLSLYASQRLNQAAEPSLGLHVLTVMAHGLCTWVLVYASLGAALRYFDHASPWTLYISQSSYWVYLLHMPVIAFACWCLAPFGISSIWKFLLAVSFTSGVCLATYHWCVQKTWISVFLNGRRFDLDWPWRSGPIAVAANQRQ